MPGTSAREGARVHAVISEMQRATGRREARALPPSPRPDVLFCVIAPAPVRCVGDSKARTPDRIPASGHARRRTSDAPGRRHRHRRPSRLCRRKALSLAVQNRVVISSGRSAGGTAQRFGAIDGIPFQVVHRTGGVVHRHELECRPAADEDLPAGSQASAHRRLIRSGLRHGRRAGCGFAPRQGPSEGRAWS